MTILQLVKKHIFSVYLVLTILITSCNQNTVYTKYTTIPEDGWSKSNKLSFDIDIQDNNALNNVYLTVRHADSYPFSNLFLFLNTTYPNGKHSIDTLECILANPKGEWLGDGTGDIFDNKILVKKNVRFPEIGKYTFTFEQGMRNNPLPLIMDFGMVIEKSK